MTHVWPCPQVFMIHVAIDEPKLMWIASEELLLDEAFELDQLLAECRVLSPETLGASEDWHTCILVFNVFELRQWSQGAISGHAGSRDNDQAVILDDCLRSLLQLGFKHQIKIKILQPLKTFGVLGFWGFIG